MKQYVIECNRSSASVFGAATTLLTKNGEVVVFDTQQAAQDKVDHITKNLISPNLWYCVVPADDYMIVSR